MAIDPVSRRTALAAFSTVAGGAAIGGSQSALAADAAARPRGQTVSIIDFGAVADSVAYGQGTDNGPAIQNAITHVWSQGGGIVHVPAVAQGDQNQPLEGRMAYGWRGGLVVPSNVRIVGDGPGGSVLRQIDNRNGPVITVGTFGPSNGTSLAACPKYPIVDVPVHAIQSQVFCRNPGDAAHFSVGDLVAIEGCATHYGSPGQYMPNMAARVVGVDRSTGSIALDQPVDDGEGAGYVTNGGVVPGIRKLDQAGVKAWTDCTGHAWPLFAAMHAGIEDLAIDVPNATGWAVINLSTYACRFRNLELNGNYLAGNPVAHTLFEQIRMTYYRGVFEGAYLAHDTVFRDCTFARHQGGVGTVQLSPLIWINQGEGGKRCHFERVTVTDRADLTSRNTVTALGLRGGSTIRDSRIVIPRGGIGYAQTQSEIRDSILLCDEVSSICAINLGSASLINCTVRGGSSHAVIADGTCHILDNVIGDQSRPPASLRIADTIQLRNGAQRSVVRGNVTAKYRGQDAIWTSAWGSRLAMATGSVMVADIPPGTFDRLLDTNWKLQGDLWLMLGGQGAGRLALMTYDGKGAVSEMFGMNFTGAAGFQHVEVEAFHHGPGSNVTAWSIRMTGAGKVLAAGAGGAGGSLPCDQIRGFALRLSGMAAGDGVDLGAGEITLIPVSIY